VGSNPTGAWVLLWVLCDVRQKSLRWTDHSSRGVLLTCCVVVRDLETLWMRRLWPNGGCRTKNKTLKQDAWQLEGNAESFHLILFHNRFSRTYIFTQKRASSDWPRIVPRVKIRDNNCMSRKANNFVQNISQLLHLWCKKTSSLCLCKVTFLLETSFFDCKFVLSVHCRILFSPVWN